MLNAFRALSKLVVPLVEAQMPKCVRSTSSSFAPFTHSVRPITRQVSSVPLVLSKNTTRRYSSQLPEALKEAGRIGSLLTHLKETSKTSMKKIYAPPGSPFTKRVIAGLNRFGPLMLVNPLFMWNLQTAYRPYLTMGFSILGGLLYLSSVIGTPDSIMRLAAVPTRYWSGEETRLLTSPFVHTHFFHFASLSGFFLAFSTAVEVAAGPLALLTVLLSTAVVGTAAAICAPERSPNMYIERTQMGLWPSVLGLAAFFHYGVRKTSPTYVMKNPNLTREQKVLARQLTATLSTRRVPLLVMAALALAPLPGVDSSAFGAIAGGLLGGALGFLWTRSPHLVLLNGVLAAAGMAYVARKPSWTLKYQAFQYAQAWENGDFIRAREWLRMFDAHSRKLANGQNESEWNLVNLALVEMACGRTSAALKYAESVDMASLVLKRDLHTLKNGFAREWQQASTNESKKANTNLTIANLIADPSKLESLKRYQQAFQVAPWRIMNDELIANLFYNVFHSPSHLTPPQMQDLILYNYKGLYNFDPPYERSYILGRDLKMEIPSSMKDNPIQ